MCILGIYLKSGSYVLLIVLVVSGYMETEMKKKYTKGYLFIF